MTRKLNEADRAAVDMLFDRINSSNSNGGNGNGGDGLVMMSGTVSDERLSAVQKVLSVLDTMPAPEPSADLIVRTLQKIARASESTTPLSTMPGTFIDPSAPLA